MIIFLLVIIALACLEDAIVIGAALIAFAVAALGILARVGGYLLAIFLLGSAVHYVRNPAQDVQRWTPVQPCERSRGVVQCAPRAPARPTRGTLYAYSDPSPERPARAPVYCGTAVRSADCPRPDGRAGDRGQPSPRLASLRR